MPLGNGKVGVLEQNALPTNDVTIPRASQLAGAKFRRQQRLVPYHADLVCRGQRLVIEIDGDTHATNIAYDAERTAYLTQEGYRVLRFTNAEVIGNSEGVALVILSALALSPSHTAAPRGLLALSLGERAA